MDPEAFVIVEVLTSSDYYDAAEAIENWIEDKHNDLKYSFWYSAEDVADIEATIARMHQQADRFRRVGDQVREQEKKVVGIT